MRSVLLNDWFQTKLRVECKQNLIDRENFRFILFGYTIKICSLALEMRLPDECSYIFEA